MTTHPLVRVILAGLIVVLLGAGYAIVANNQGSDDSQSAPTGFFH